MDQPVPLQQTPLQPLRVAIALAALVLVGALAIFVVTNTKPHVTSAPAFSWGMSSFRISFPNNPSGAIFSQGAFVATSTPPPRLYADPLSKFLAHGVTASSDPDQNRVVVPGTGVVISGVTDPQAMPNTRFIVVRRTKDLALCAGDGSCMSLYSFGKEFRGRVLYAVGGSTLAVLNPFSGDLQGFTLDVSGSSPKLTFVRSVKPPYPGASSFTFDPGIPGRILFASAIPGQSKDIPMAIPTGYPNSGQKIVQHVPVTAVSVCAYDGLFSKTLPTPEQPQCASTTTGGPFINPVITPL